LIKKGFVTISNKTIIKTGIKLKINDVIKVELPKTIKTKSLNVDFDVPIIYEDDDVLVINKPSGVIVHGAPSVAEPTLVDWLKLRNISLSTISGEERHGIIHRLDKGTSGLMVVAKTNKAHILLSKQLQDKTMGRFYVALIDLPLKDDINIDKPIGRNPNNRLKQAIIRTGRVAKTKLVKLAISNDEKIELILAKLYTGRTHQIRVHLESINRHILGDSLYGFQGNLDKITRVNLHSIYLYFVHPSTNQKISFDIPMAEDMYNTCEKYFNMEVINEKTDSKYILDNFGDI
jgi:23S rRNA pseudouridine1911/1915/1917 synthase